jgi:hypothetical protein
MELGARESAIPQRLAPGPIPAWHRARTPGDSLGDLRECSGGAPCPMWSGSLAPDPSIWLLRPRVARPVRSHTGMDDMFMEVGR